MTPTTTTGETTPATTETTACVRCNGFGIVGKRVAYRKFEDMICGACEGTGVEPDHTYDAFAAHVGRINR